MVANGSRSVSCLTRQFLSHRNYTMFFLLFFLCFVYRTAPSGAGINSETDEPDSLETAKDVASPVPSATGTIRTAKNGATSTKINADTSSSEGELLALLQLERLAQQASRRDYELLRTQYQRYFLSFPLDIFFYRDFQSCLAVQ